jgi:hypothetical protein
MKHDRNDVLPHSEFLVDQEEIAKRLLVAPKTLEAWRSRGGGPPFCRVGRLIRYSPLLVQRWVEQNICQSTSEPAVTTRKIR